MRQKEKNPREALLGWVASRLAVVGRGEERLSCERVALEREVSRVAARPTLDDLKRVQKEGNHEPQPLRSNGKEARLAGSERHGNVHSAALLDLDKIRADRDSLGPDLRPRSYEREKESELFHDRRVEVVVLVFKGDQFKPPPEKREHHA